MSKAVFLLLERYHRSHVLGVVGCFRPVGAEYSYFYSHAIRSRRGRAKYLAEEASPPGYALAISQWECRLVGQHDLLFPRWSDREVRTGEIVDWLERHLGHHALLADHEDDLRGWRERYTDGQSERYLLAWNGFGLLSAASSHLVGGGIATSGRFDMFVYQLDEGAVRHFAIKYPDENVYYCRGIAVSSGARATGPGRGVRDLWSERLQGKPLRETVASLLMTNVA